MVSYILCLMISLLDFGLTRTKKCSVYGKVYVSGPLLFFSPIYITLRCRLVNKFSSTSNHELIGLYSVFMLCATDYIPRAPMQLLKRFIK